MVSTKELVADVMQNSDPLTRVHGPTTLLCGKQLASVNSNYKFSSGDNTFNIYELPNIPLLDDSSAPSLYPKTLNTYHQTVQRNDKTISHLIPVYLLTCKRQSTAKALECFLPHLLIGFIQRNLIFSFFIFDERNYLGCRRVRRG